MRAGLGCGLGWTTAVSVTHTADEAAYVACGPMWVLNLCLPCGPGVPQLPRPSAEYKYCMLLSSIKSSRTNKRSNRCSAANDTFSGQILTEAEKHRRSPVRCSLPQSAAGARVLGLVSEWYPASYGDSNVDSNKRKEILTTNSKTWCQTWCQSCRTVRMCGDRFFFNAFFNRAFSTSDWKWSHSCEADIA